MPYVIQVLQQKYNKRSFKINFNKKQYVCIGNDETDPIFVKDVTDLNI